MGARLYSPQSGYTWTPAFITYGDNNRTQMIRCPEGGHFEDRTVSGGMNPYLSFAAYLAAGLDGIRRKLDPGAPNIANMYTTTPAERDAMKIRLLPQSIPEALGELEKDEVIQSALGPIYNEFIALKKAEWSDYHAHVGRWEIDRYLTMF
jgi:glutamine synthetase